MILKYDPQSLGPWHYRAMFFLARGLGWRSEKELKGEGVDVRVLPMLDIKGIAEKRVFDDVEHWQLTMHARSHLSNKIYLE